MTKILFENLPSKNTPINAENLNKLNNLAIDTTVDGHDEEVVLIKENNILDGYEIINNYYISSNGTITEDNKFCYTSLLPINVGNYKIIGCFNPTIPETWNFRIHGYDGNGNWVSQLAFKTIEKHENEISFTNTNNNIKSVRLSITNETNAIDLQKTICSLENEMPRKIYANGEKYTDTVNIGNEPNNAGLWVKPNKNLLYCDLNSKTTNGITITKNSDGSYKLNGTASTDFNIEWNTTQLSLKKGKYYIGLLQPININLYFITSGGSTKIITNSLYDKQYVEFNVENDETYTALRSWVTKGRVLDNVTVYPIIYREIPDGYEKFSSSSIEANINGTYETIARKNVYSPEEIVIGEWFGKPLYRKVITYTNSSEIGNASGRTTIQIPHNISNMEDCIFAHVKRKGRATMIPSIYMNTSLEQQSTCINEVDSTNINFSLVRSTYVSSTWNFILEYTKTTD